MTAAFGRDIMDFRISKEQSLIRQTIREFAQAQNEVKPISRKLDTQVDPKQCFSWELVGKASKLGLRLLPLPVEYGGSRITDQSAQIIIMEELGAGDLGFASVFRSQISLVDMFMRLCNQEQKEEFIPRLVADDTYLLAACMSEPDHGTDTAIPYDVPGEGLETFAEKKEREYVINGVKHFTSNGGIAKLYFVYARTNRKLPLSKSLSCFLVPHDTPGFSIGSIPNKLGRRLLMNAEEVFQDVSIPARYLVGKENNAWEERKILGPVGLLHSAAQLGVLRACYEEALSYAKIRIQGGRPIIEHTNIGAKLGEMRIKIEAAKRLILWNAWCWDNDNEYDPRMHWLIKGFTDEVTLHILNHTVDIFGGIGTDKDSSIEKYIRDLYTILHGFGTREMSLAKVASAL
jgi:alkylation response protein AidB-like acyl-CoA dehydrogenase